MNTTLSSSLSPLIIANSTLIYSINEISKQVNRYLALIIIIFGVIGNLFNCFVLNQRTLRSNPCAIYFLFSSIFNLISILFGLTTRILAGWQLDPTSHDDFLCQLRAFILFTSRTIGLWLIMLATIDRWLLSSPSIQRRQMSSVKNTHRGILVSCLFSILFYFHIFYCYRSRLTDTPLPCYGKSIQCRLMMDLIYALITILIPSILMIVFCLMIVSNVHHLHIRVQTMHTVSFLVPIRPRDWKLKRTDYQLLRMLLFQVVLLIIFCIPQAIQKFYISLRPFRQEATIEDVVKRFLYNLELLMAFIASGMPFYLYTLSGGTIFRRASMNFVQLVHQKFKLTI